eukprot:4096165-Amphidinium_carterae.1
MLGVKFAESSFEVFCNMANTTIGKEASGIVPEGVSCLALVLGLSELACPCVVSAAQSTLERDLRVDAPALGESCGSSRSRSCPQHEVPSPHHSFSLTECFASIMLLARG